MKERAARYDLFQSFIERHYIKTDACYDSDLLEIEDPGFDCYICVTDVIWKYNPGDGFDRGFFLASKAMEGKWKISYAASRGVPKELSKLQKNEFLHYVEDIDFLSVREESLKAYLEANLDRKVEMVLDPVLMQDKVFYDRLAIKPKEQRYVLVYYVMERAADTITMAVQYAREHGLTVIELADRPQPYRPEGYENIDTIYRYDIGVEQWIGYIKYAERVFTNSFHGTCLSILFEKKFFVGKRNGDKITNLLNVTGLSSRRVASIDQIHHIDNESIDYEDVKTRLEALRNSSENFILNALDACRNNIRTNRNYTSWKHELRYKLIYHSGVKNPRINNILQIGDGFLESLPSGNIQYTLSKKIPNNESARLAPQIFDCPGKRFAGWRLRVRIDNRWFWYQGVDRLVPNNNAWKAAVLAPEFPVPYFEVNNIETVVAEAVWECEQFTIRYNSGFSTGKCFSCYTRLTGTTKTLATGSKEYTPKRKIPNDGKQRITINRFVRPSYRFVGWIIRMKERGRWYWLLKDGTYTSAAELNPQKKEELLTLANSEFIPRLNAHDATTLVAEAIWQPKKQ